MFFFVKKTFRDMADNAFLHFITIITIALSILIASAAGLLFVNAGDVVDNWKKGIRIIAYVKADAPKALKNRTPIDKTTIENVKKSIEGFAGVKEVIYVSKADALAGLKKQMKHQLSVVESLDGNPLPDSFEVELTREGMTWERIEALATLIGKIDIIDDVEYGQSWIGRFTSILSLCKFIALSMGVLFLMVTVFIISNTIRLALYSRRDEIEIMRLVGATDTFIKIPAYLAGIIQGAAGGLIGLLSLYISYRWLVAKIGQSFSAYEVSIRFLSRDMILWILLYSICVGWLGCLLSLRQFLKKI